jgi:hypothetical protein
MTRQSKALLAVGLLMLAIMFTSHRASAQATDDVASQYAQSMWYFVPVLGRLSNEIDRTLAAAQVKPELAPQLADLAKRAEFMVYDLEGTPAPAQMAAVHEELMASLRQLVEAAQIGVDNPAGARYLYDRYAPTVLSSRQVIRGWLLDRVESAGQPTDPAAMVGL